MHEGFSVTVGEQGQVRVIAISGELDLATAPELESALDGVAAPPATLVIVDLRGLEFMDSTGLSIIVRAHQRLADAGCELGLVKGSPQVQRLLDLTGVAERLRLVSDPDELLPGR